MMELWQCLLGIALVWLLCVSIFMMAKTVVAFLDWMGLL